MICKLLANSRIKTSSLYLDTASLEESHTCISPTSAYSAPWFDQRHGVFDCWLHQLTESSSSFLLYSNSTINENPKQAIFIQQIQKPRTRCPWTKFKSLLIAHATDILWIDTKHRNFAYRRDKIMSWIRSHHHKRRWRSKKDILEAINIFGHPPKSFILPDTASIRLSEETCGNGA